jgi:hypothetical protein
MNEVLEKVIDDKGTKRYRVYSPKLNEAPYTGDAVDCKEMMELHGYMTTPPAPQRDLSLPPQGTEAQEVQARERAKDDLARNSNKKSS